MTQIQSQPSDIVTQPNEDDEEDSLFDLFYDEQGSLPGTLRLKAGAPPPTIVLIDYNEANATRKQVAVPEACASYLDKESVSWVDVLGLGNQETWRQLGEVFKLHPLVLEDVVNVPQR